jgi:hypothetical protein
MSTVFRFSVATFAVTVTTYHELSWRRQWRACTEITKSSVMRCRHFLRIRLRCSLPWVTYWISCLRFFRAICDVMPYDSWNMVLFLPYQVNKRPLALPPRLAVWKEEIPFPSHQIRLIPSHFGHQNLFSLCKFAELCEVSHSCPMLPNLNMYWFFHH